MKFYSKRGNYIVLDSSRILNEIFFDIQKQSQESIEQNYLFMIQEDKVLQKMSEESLLCLPVDIVPHAKNRRMPYNFENFQSLYHCLLTHHVIPYIGEDMVNKK